MLKASQCHFLESRKYLFFNAEGRRALQGGVDKGLVRCRFRLSASILALTCAGEPDYELKCIAFWKENLRSYLITYNKEDAYSKYRCWVRMAHLFTPSLFYYFALVLKPYICSFAHILFAPSVVQNKSYSDLYIHTLS